MERSDLRRTGVALGDRVRFLPALELGGWRIIRAEGLLHHNPIARAVTKPSAKRSLPRTGWREARRSRCGGGLGIRPCCRLWAVGMYHNRCEVCRRMNRVGLPLTARARHMVRRNSKSPRSTCNFIAVVISARIPERTACHDTFGEWPSEQCIRDRVCLRRPSEKRDDEGSGKDAHGAD